MVVETIISVVLWRECAVVVEDSKPHLIVADEESRFSKED